MQVTDGPVPPDSLIASYAAQRDHHADCFACTVAGQVSLADFVSAFYKTPVFRLERLVLRFVQKNPADDATIDALAAGQADAFAVWTVEARTRDQLLMHEGRTKSWFQVIPQDGQTQLLFGSVVVPDPASVARGKPTLGPVFNSLLTAHKVYSRVLLASAARAVRGKG